MEAANLKYLDEIQEEHRSPRPKTRGLLWALALAAPISLAWALRQPAPDRVAAIDPVAELLKQKNKKKEAPNPPPAQKAAPLSVDELLSRPAAAPQATDSLMPQEPESEPEFAEAGHEGGFQLQVASVKSRAAADALVIKLRRHGHRAYRRAARVPKRGLWHRVRIGPFSSQFEAERYQDSFAAKEGRSTLLVKPSG